MHRINTPSAVADLFGTGKPGFTDGDPVGGIPATFLNAAWFNTMQEELAGLVEYTGLDLDAGDREQLRKAVVAVSLSAVANKLRGASGGDTEIDWNTVTTWGLSGIALRGDNPNGPGGNGFFVPWIVDYANGESLTQIAIPLATNVSGGMMMRGRISNGTWAAWRPAIRTASTSAQGVIEIATVTETRSGTDDTRAVTPAGLRALSATAFTRASARFVTTLPTDTITRIGLGNFESDGQGDFIMDNEDLVCQRAGRYFAMGNFGVLANGNAVSAMTAGSRLNGAELQSASLRLTTAEILNLTGGAANIIDLSIDDRISGWAYQASGTNESMLVDVMISFYRLSQN